MLFRSVEKPSDVLSIGQEIEAKVMDFNEEDHKISLSMKALQTASYAYQDEDDVEDVDIDAVAAEDME